MKFVTISELFDVTSSKRVFQSEWTDFGVPFYRAREIVKLSREGHVKNDLFISETMYSKYSSKYGAPKEGDLLVTGVGTLGICYQVKSEDRFYFKDGNIVWFKKKSSVSSDYVEYCFKSPYVKRQIASKADGATVGTYTITNAKETKIPLPPLEQQQQITAILDAADELRQKDKALIAKYDELTQSLFLDMFGDPVTNPKKWKSVKLESVCGKITDGTHKTPIYKDSGVIFLSAKNIKKYELNCDSPKYISKEEHALLSKRCNVEKDDILITKSGSLGMAAMVGFDFEFSIFESLALLKYIRESIDGKFLLYYLNTPSTQYKYAGITKGVGVKHLHLSDLRRLDIILPSRAI